MKRIALLLLGFFSFVTAPAMAQVIDFSQRGRATGELNAGALSIAHASLPLNSQAKVVNIATGKEVEVTVTGRIPASPNRIADLSPDVWQALELAPGAEVRVYTSAVPRPRPAPEPIVVETPPVTAELPPAIPEPATKAAPTIASPEPVQPRVVPPAYPVQPAAAAAEVIIIPGLPDPSTDKVFSLQVGAFSGQESALRTARLVASLGFHVVWEESGSLYRVFAIDVPAMLIHSAAQRLAYAGIREIWVRE